MGETPLERLEIFRKDTGIGENVPLAYAGRLDPLAQGKLLILIGDECKKLKLYTGLDKEYTFEVLFGFSTDTGDVLGLGQYSKNEHVLKEEVTGVIEKFVGDVSFPYPQFSSKTVQGKQLHKWALEGRIHEIEIPLRDSKIYKLKLIKTHTITSTKLQKLIFEKINSIPPVTDPSKAHGRDFRRVEIRARWEELFTNTQQSDFFVATFSCTASSGTYMRTLAEEIGKSLGTNSLALSITRNIIGKYRTFGPFGMWIRKY